MTHPATTLMCPTTVDGGVAAGGGENVETGSNGAFQHRVVQPGG